MAQTKNSAGRILTGVASTFEAAKQQAQCTDSVSAPSRLPVYTSLDELFLRINALEASLTIAWEHIRLLRGEIGE